MNLDVKIFACVGFIRFFQRSYPRTQKKFWLKQPEKNVMESRTSNLVKNVRNFTKHFSVVLIFYSS